MARNKLAGTKVGDSKSAKYYQNNPKAKDKKDKYNAKYGASLSRKLYRAGLNAINRKKGKKGDGKDVSHTKDGGTVLESQKNNRARNRGRK
jgi:hypothetical protein|tara:strand:- start:139 stop:411 length:273 start_codon:yes stop_codon:yes gene_type:complete